MRASASTRTFTGTMHGAMTRLTEIVTVPSGCAVQVVLRKSLPHATRTPGHRLSPAASLTVPVATVGPGFGLGSAGNRTFTATVPGPNLPPSGSESDGTPVAARWWASAAFAPHELVMK